MELKAALYQKEGAVAVITLNRPDALNALDSQMQEDLASIIEELWNDDGVRSVLLQGSGRSFSAGGDIKTMLTSLKELPYLKRRDYLSQAHVWVKRFATLEKPVVVAVKGYAVGAGMSLALMGDIIVAAESAQFSPSFARMGLLPDLAALYYLPRLTGLNKAKELCFTGAYLTAAEAQELGLVNRVVPDDRLEAESRELAEKLAQGPTKALGLTKMVLNRSLESTLEEILLLEAQLQPAAAGSEDFEEGIAAFLEKRSPSFKGR